MNKSKNKDMSKKIVVIGLSGESVFLNIDHMNNDGETVKANNKKNEIIFIIIKNIIK